MAGDEARRAPSLSTLGARLLRQVLERQIAALRAQGADPGDQTGLNADVPAFAHALAMRPQSLETV